jgi:DNA ligase (NAD+)
VRRRRTRRRVRHLHSIVDPLDSIQAAKQRLQDLGARVSGSVSRKTSLVVAGDDPGSKRDRAQTLGVEIVSEEGLERLIRERGGSALWDQ